MGIGNGSGENETSKRDLGEAYSKNKRRLTSAYYPVQLSARDLSVLQFVLEMKFASAKHLHDRFFATTLAGTEAVSSRWSEKRLMQLERGGMLDGEFVYKDRKKYFIATSDALRAVCISIRQPLWRNQKSRSRISFSAMTSSFSKADWISS